MALNLLRLLKQPVSHSRQLVSIIERSHVLHAASAIKDGFRLKADHVGCVSFIKYYASKGYITATVDYTLQNHGIDAPISVMNEEIEQAVSAICDKAEEHGYHIRITPAHSAEFLDKTDAIKNMAGVDEESHKRK